MKEQGEAQRKEAIADDEKEDSGSGASELFADL